MALIEIIIGATTGFLAFKFHYTPKLALNDDWLKFCASIGAIMLTFLSGAELNPDVMKTKFKEITIIGLIAFKKRGYNCFSFRANSRIWIQILRNHYYRITSYYCYLNNKNNEKNNLFVYNNMFVVQLWQGFKTIDRIW